MQADEMELAQDDDMPDDDDLLTKKSLNEIRFEKWGDKDWFDNEYIRTLRRYIDDFNEGASGG